MSDWDDWDYGRDADIEDQERYEHDMAVAEHMHEQELNERERGRG